jgi:hypothetical protein
MDAVRRSSYVRGDARAFRVRVGARAAAAALLVLWVLSSAAFAAEPHGWDQQQISGPPNAVLRQVSCISSHACLAVGDSNSGLFAERYDGREWQSTSPRMLGDGRNSGLEAVSCAGVRFCMAVGGSSARTGGGGCALASVWSAGRWQDAAAGLLSGSRCEIRGPLSALSCPSATFCLAAVGNGPVLRWNGRAWSAIRAPDAGNRLSISAVSCRSAHGCAVVGEDDFGLVLGWWNGLGWTLRALTSAGAAGPAPDIAGVSCPAGDDCVAIGLLNGRTRLFDWDGAHWQTGRGKFKFLARALSCVSASRCSAPTDPTGEISDFKLPRDRVLSTVSSLNLDSWTQLGPLPAQSSGPYGPVQEGYDGVSCVGSGWCMTVGGTNLQQDHGPLSKPLAASYEI